MPFIKYAFLIQFVLLAVGCGGGGSDSDTEGPVVSDVGFSKLSGMWLGESFQGSGIACSDGSFIGAGVGTGAQEISFEIGGADSFNQEGTLQFGSCTYFGVRQTLAEMEFFSSDSSCLDSIVLYEIEESGVARFSTTPRPAENQEACVISRGGEVSRQG